MHKRLGASPRIRPVSPPLTTVLSAYGILANRDSLSRLGVWIPTAWIDLTDVRLLGEVALADPAKSASAAKAYEMIIQQQMHRRLETLAESEPDRAIREAMAVPEGWIEGLRVIQLAAANARYFTDSAQKPPVDVGQGDAAAGVGIDFFGRFQAESLARRQDGLRFQSR